MDEDQGNWVDLGLVDEDGEEPLPLVTMLNNSYHQSQRLEQERRWIRQYELNLPLFLANHDRTFNWGNPAETLHDVKAPCDCRGKNVRVRMVDMLDTIDRCQRPISFCACQSDQGRLIQMGFLGALPIHPKTAFSLRFLHMYHIIWKHCCVKNEPFSEALDEWLDAFFPPITSEKTNRRRDFRKPLSSASDCYCRLITAVRKKEIKLLKLSELEQLAANCPRCFGPPAPDAKSQEDPAKVEVMAEAIRNNRSKKDDEHVDPCTAQHTAADDIRDKSHWGGCDDTGLLGMACRHDHVLKFVNIVQSGEKSCYALALVDWLLEVTENRGMSANKVAILYDIGCNIEKGIIKQKQFAKERAAGRLKFGTSVFHAYVHEWLCQLSYNPRLNAGWGLSDGEGLEQIWSFLSPLVSPLRYSTSQHQLESLSLRSLHLNHRNRYKAVMSMQTHLKKVKKRLVDAQKSLNGPHMQHGYTLEYLSVQWDRQRKAQMDVISTTTAEKKKGINEMLDLEEELIETRERLHKLKVKRVRSRTRREKLDLLNIPKSLALLEDQIHSAAAELGSEEFLELTGLTDDRATPLLALQLAKGKLYEAMVGVVEARRRAQRTGGTTSQTRLSYIKSYKTKVFKRKYNSYHRRVKAYNDRFSPTPRMEDASLAEVEGMDLSHMFWAAGSTLSHPEEPWASELPTREGIQAFLTHRSSQEELCRIAREAR